MWPSIGPIPSYGILYAIGIVAHFLVSGHIAKRLGLARYVGIAVSVCYLLGMIVGAKLLFDIYNSQLNLTALLDIQHYLRGGLWGGLLAYVVLAVPLVALLTDQKGAALDLVALTIPIPWCLAKLGCLMNGCCYGRPSLLPWAITFPEGGDAPAGIPLHPTQVYEILAVLAILLVFRIVENERSRGTLLLWFLMLYGFGRAAMDAFRGDFNRNTYLGPINLTQLVCLVTGTVSLLLLLLILRRSRTTTSMG
jgi:phosphatidylglycerol:prolipoprotein diacylglycerol transferase